MFCSAHSAAVVPVEIPAPRLEDLSTTEQYKLLSEEVLPNLKKSLIVEAVGDFFSKKELVGMLLNLDVNEGELTGYFEQELREHLES